MDKVFGVTFKDGGKVYNFKSNLDCKVNDNVIVNTENGQQYGKIATLVDKDSVVKKIDSLSDIVKIADSKDYSKYLKNLKDADKALKDARDLVKELNLDMSIISSSLNFDRSQLLISFLADERIDFRELAKRLAAIYHTRIELRQVGARDKAKEIGGIGVCGRKLCCHGMLTSIDTVTINMAKNQNLALNPSKINGQCNRLLCCLSFEDDNYTEARKDMPKMGSKMDTEIGKGEIVNLDLLNRKCTVQVENERIVVDLSDKSKK